jgi:RES domain-containing protein
VRGLMLSKTTALRQLDTHRLIPAKYGENDDSVLNRIASDERHLQDLFDLDHATNDRLLGENGLVPGIARHELVFGVPYYRIVNATFTHAHPLGGRFNAPDRGAWYAGFEIETSLSEVAFHKSVEYAEIQRFDDSVVYADYLADFSGPFHDLRARAEAARHLAPDSYVASQGLALELLEAGSAGVIYPSVRHHDGTCLCCFRPVLVGNVRRGASYRLSWAGTPDPVISIV